MKVAGLREQAMDVAIIDAVWNGVWQAMKIAGAADAFEVNFAQHNFYGHLAMMMNAHFAFAASHSCFRDSHESRNPESNVVY